MSERDVDAVVAVKALVKRAFVVVVAYAVVALAFARLGLGLGLGLGLRLGLRLCLCFSLGLVVDFSHVFARHGSWRHGRFRGLQRSRRTSGNR